MADLAIFEKYPNSWRVDHPNYGDVAKTTYAKGVIGDGADGSTAFDVLYFYRFRVRSMVKVEGAWGVSDYIPLFYHPKAQYWDDPPNNLLAQDYNVAGGYFEKAWMSFRVGDEVKVMLKEKQPVAVVGFADGVPRIGEDVVKMVVHPQPGTDYFDATLIFKLDPPSVYFISGPLTSPYYPPLSSSENGPDGLDLKLVEPPILIRKIRYYEYGGHDMSEYDQFVVVGPILYIFCHWYGIAFIGESIRAALYTPELLDSLSNYPLPTLIEMGDPLFNGTTYPNTYLQNELLYVMGTVIRNGYPPYANSWMYWFSHDLTVRPHTK